MSTKNINTSSTAASQGQPKYKRSPLNLALNIGIILYSLYRLYPLTQGEELPTWRIVLSGGLLLFCSWAVYKHFKATSTT